MSSEVFGQVETSEDQICEIMELFCEVQEEVCREMVTQHDAFEEDWDNMIDHQENGEIKKG